MYFLRVSNPAFIFFPVGYFAVCFILSPIYDITDSFLAISIKCVSAPKVLSLIWPNYITRSYGWVSVLSLGSPRFLLVVKIGFCMPDLFGWACLIRSLICLRQVLDGVQGKLMTSSYNSLSLTSELSFFSSSWSSPSLMSYEWKFSRSNRATDILPHGLSKQHIGSQELNLLGQPFHLTRYLISVPPEPSAFAKYYLSRILSNSYCSDVISGFLLPYWSSSSLDESRDELFYVSLVPD